MIWLLTWINNRNVAQFCCSWAVQCPRWHAAMQTMLSGISKFALNCSVVSKLFPLPAQLPNPPTSVQRPVFCCLSQQMVSVSKGTVTPVAHLSTLSMSVHTHSRTLCTPLASLVIWTSAFQLKIVGFSIESCACLPIYLVASLQLLRRVWVFQWSCRANCLENVNKGSEWISQKCFCDDAHNQHT